MYLVVLRHLQDDLPIRLCQSYDEAMSVAMAASWEPPARLSDLLQIDCTTPCAIGIFGFDAAGEPASFKTVRTYDEETADR